MSGLPIATSSRALGPTTLRAQLVDIRDWVDQLDDECADAGIPLDYDVTGAHAPRPNIRMYLGALRTVARNAIAHLETGEQGAT